MRNTRGGKLQGYFRRIEESKWQEQAVSGDTRDYTEVKRDESSVYLKSGDIYIQLNLATNVGLYSADNFQTTQKLYDLKNPQAKKESQEVSSTPTPTPIAPVIVQVDGEDLVYADTKQRGTPTGSLSWTRPGVWTEVYYRKSSEWTEVSRTADEIVLAKSGRQLKILVDAKRVYLSTDDFRSQSSFYDLGNLKAGTPIPSGQALVYADTQQRGTHSGSLTWTNSGIWIENYYRKPSEWKEVSRTQEEIVLAQGSRKLKLILATQKVYNSNNNFQTQNAYYDLINLRAGERIPSGDVLVYAETSQRGVSSGSLSWTRPGVWTEDYYGKRSEWTELSRTPEQIVIGKGGRSLKLVLGNKNVYNSNDNFKTQNAFYDLRNFKSGDPVPSGSHLIYADTKQNGRSTGYLRWAGPGEWIERYNGAHFEWEEVSRSAEEIVIAKGARKLKIVLASRNVYNSNNNFQTQNAFSDLLNFKAGNPTAAPAYSLSYVTPPPPGVKPVPALAMNVPTAFVRVQKRPGKPVPKEILPTSGPTPQLTQQMREFAQGGNLDLGTLAAFKGSAFSNITIQTPVVSRDGSITGTSTFGGQQAPVLLQYVAEEGGIGNWIVAFKAPLSKLSDVLPSVAGTVVDKFHFRDTILTFAPKEAEVKSTDLAPSVRAFYANVYGDGEFTLSLNKGIGILTSAKPLGPIEKAMGQIGTTNPQIVIHGTLVKDFEISALREAKKEGKLKNAIKEGLELRATLPAIRVEASPWVESRRTELLISGAPSVGIEFDLTIKEKDGSSHEIDFSVAVEKQTTGVQLTAVGKLKGPGGVYEDAFGIKDFDIKEAIVTINFDSSQNVGFGLGGEFGVGDRNLKLAGAFKFNLATGVPTDIAFAGSIDLIKLEDMVDLANQFARIGNAQKLEKGGIPDIYMKGVSVRIAPKDGNKALGIEQGFELKGELFAMDKQIAKVDATISTGDGQPSIDIKGYIHPFDLKVIKLRKGDVDISLGSSIDPHFIINADATVGLKRVELYANINKEIALGGLSAAKWASTHAGKLLAVVQEIKVTGDLGKYAGGAKVTVEVKLKLKGEPKVIKLQASAADIENNNIAKLLFEEIKRVL